MTPEAGGGKTALALRPDGDAERPLGDRIVCRRAAGAGGGSRASSRRSTSIRGSPRGVGARRGAPRSGSNGPPAPPRHLQPARAGQAPRRRQRHVQRIATPEKRENRRSRRPHVVFAPLRDHADRLGGSLVGRLELPFWAKSRPKRLTAWPELRRGTSRGPRVADGLPAISGGAVDLDATATR